MLVSRARAVVATVRCRRPKHRRAWRLLAAAERPIGAASHLHYIICYISNTRLRCQYPRDCLA